jgi:hypothetical protein
MRSRLKKKEEFEELICGRFIRVITEVAYRLP